MKKCSKCKIEKELDKFALRIKTHSKDGYNPTTL